MVRRRFERRAAVKAALVDPIPFVWLNVVLTFVVMKVFALPMTILSFWLVFWWVPNGKVPLVQVFPASVLLSVIAGVAIAPTMRLHLPA